MLNQYQYDIFIAVITTERDYSEGYYTQSDSIASSLYLNDKN